MNKVENVRHRLKWLQAVVDGGQSLSSDEVSALQTAKSFCALNVPGIFDSLSYNTMKSVLAKSSLIEFGAHPYVSNLDYFLDLRASCRRRIEASKPQPIAPASVLDWKHSYRNALWHSNLCSQAYLALVRDVQAVLDAGASDSRLDYRRIERILSKSSATYLKVISMTAEPFDPELKVV
ncbi:hypothetical protein ACSQ5K_14705 [Pseudomonas sp. PhalM4]